MTTKVKVMASNLLAMASTLVAMDDPKRMTRGDGCCSASCEIWSLQRLRMKEGKPGELVARLLYRLQVGH